jgi:transposase
MPKPGRRGRPREVVFREVINAVRYIVRSGCGRRMLPIHFGPWKTVYGWFLRRDNQDEKPYCLSPGCS